MLKRIIKTLAIALLLAAPLPASAQCYADYKAKKSAPLRLHYGVLELNGAACNSRNAAARVTAQRISRGGWTLLTVLSVFGPSGLNARRQSAGQFFLRY